ncbi:MAG: hypothetical protein SVV03_01760 [Candidatus Nanohaloarchaea archaeon]|nr:hypothetical protein [Candidatus Nanohaloarchaea archaeon]
MAEVVHTATKKYIEESEEWTPSVGLALGKHYRHRDSTAHAVKKLGKKYYEIHYDRENPHHSFLGHMVKDTPLLFAALIAGGLTGVYRWFRE